MSAGLHAALAAAPLSATLASLRGPLPAPAAPPFTLTLLYLALSSLIVVAWRRRKCLPPAGAAPPFDPPQTLPLLEEMAARFEAGQFSPEELCLILASFARVRLAQATGLPASRLTSAELLQQAEASGLLSASELEQAAELFELCDRVKFAAELPDSERARRSLELARALFPHSGGKP
ncbi:hypothetical protein [Citrifermentans bremense]|uniref:hypothetical protein n=1 Tax=Citrifermentans bremense TaxID=60035 RepID=UPI0003F6F132|nr:hypothetical protein [Citrifermentans bremense]